MAKRKLSKRNKIEPAMQTLLMAVPIVPPGSTVTMYVDLSQVASLVNRRFYRQGLNWAVSGFKILTGSGVTGGVTITKLPNTWTMSNAWEKSFRAWQRMNNEALSEAESVRPRFLDFKIYADASHHAAGFGTNLLPVSATATYAAGEWEPSKIVVPETTTATGAATSYELIATGANNPGAGASGLNAKSLIEGYAASRGLPNIEDPNTPDDAASYTENWMLAMFNDGNLQDNEVVTDMINENNLAPYPFENDGVNLDTMYPGGANQGSGLQIHDSAFITGSTIGGTTYLKGGNFPCGLIRIDMAADLGTPDNQSPLLLIDLMPGNHRGYLAEPMTEM